MTSINTNMQGNEKVFNGFIKSFISEEEHKEKSALAKDILNTRYAKGVFKESHGIREDYDIDDFVIVPREMFKPKGR